MMYVVLHSTLKITLKTGLRWSQESNPGLLVHAGVSFLPCGVQVIHHRFAPTSKGLLGPLSLLTTKQSDQDSFYRVKIKQIQKTEFHFPVG
jgi:hypothetical protein